MHSNFFPYVETRQRLTKGNGMFRATNKTEISKRLKHVSKKSFSDQQDLSEIHTLNSAHFLARLILNNNESDPSGEITPTDLPIKSQIQ